MTMWPDKIIGFTDMADAATLLNDVAAIAGLVESLPIKVSIQDMKFLGAGKLSFEFMKKADATNAWSLKFAADDDVSFSGTWQNRTFTEMWSDESMALTIPKNAALLNAEIDGTALTMAARFDVKGTLDLPAFLTLRLFQNNGRDFNIPNSLPASALLRLDLNGIQGVLGMDNKGILHLDDVVASGAKNGMYIVVDETVTPLFEIDLKTAVGNETSSLVDHWFAIVENFNRATYNLSPSSVTTFLADACKFYTAIGSPEESGVDPVLCGQAYSLALNPVVADGEVSMAGVRYCSRKRNTTNERSYDVALQMVKGTMTLSTTLAGHDPIVVAEGKCLMTKHVCVPTDPETFLDCMEAADCPYYTITTAIVQTGDPAADHGTAFVSPRVTAECGDTRAVTLTPDTDYKVAKVVVDGYEISYLADIMTCELNRTTANPERNGGFQVCKVADSKVILVTFQDIYRNHTVGVTFDEAVAPLITAFGYAGKTGVITDGNTVDVDMTGVDDAALAADGSLSVTEPCDLAITDPLTSQSYSWPLRINETFNLNGVVTLKLLNSYVNNPAFAASHVISVFGTITDAHQNVTKVVFNFRYDTPFITAFAYAGKTGVVTNGNTVDIDLTGVNDTALAADGSISVTEVCKLVIANPLDGNKYEWPLRIDETFNFNGTVTTAVLSEYVKKYGSPIVVKGELRSDNGDYTNVLFNIAYVL